MNETEQTQKPKYQVKPNYIHHKTQGRYQSGARICQACGLPENNKDLFDGGDSDLWIIKVGNDYLHRKCTDGV